MENRQSMAIDDVDRVCDVPPLTCTSQVSTSAPTEYFIPTDDCTPSNQKQLAWFCIRTQPKREHIATANLRKIDGLEVLCPRIRFKRATRRGPVWVNEALFPGYLFAKFDWLPLKKAVQASHGVSTIVHFGAKWPTIPEYIIEELRQSLGDDDVASPAEEFIPGEEIGITGGPFNGLRALVTFVFPAGERLRVLLSFLGQLVSLDLHIKNAVRSISPGVLAIGRT